MPSRRLQHHTDNSNTVLYNLNFFNLSGLCSGYTLKMCRTRKSTVKFVPQSRVDGNSGLEKGGPKKQ